MNRSVIFHNPDAGDSDHQPEELMFLIKKEGFSCRYISIKSKGWQDFDEHVDFLIAGGGDGCVRRVVEMLLHRTLMQPQFPLAIVPLGTANNLSRTLGIKSDPGEAIAAMKTSVTKRFDVGFINGFPKREFFIEGVGLGVFPALMKRMKGFSHQTLSAEDKLTTTLMVFQQIVEKFKPMPVVVIADGTRYEGDYLMVEIMNTKSIGPNLVLAESADPGDGELELVLIGEEQREQLLDYIHQHINGRPGSFFQPGLKVKKIKFLAPPTTIHIDDKPVQYWGGKLSVSLKNGLLEILTPQTAAGVATALSPKAQKLKRGKVAQKVAEQSDDR